MEATVAPHNAGFCNVIIYEKTWNSH